jgi:signal peptide peptidase SppA
MRTHANLWALHAGLGLTTPGQLEAYLRERQTGERLRAESKDEAEKRKAKEHPMRGKVVMQSAREAEAAWYPISVVGRTAIVHVDGVMWKGSWGCCTLEIRRCIEAAAADPEIDAILLRFDTPGGSVDGLAELGDAVFAVRQRQAKPVIAQVDGMCCSAGYYVASQADEIRSGRMDTIGSIGTRMLLYDWHVLFEKEGIEAVPIDTGAYKSTGALGTEITPEQRAFLQEYVNAYFADFKAVIGRGRQALRGERLDAIADGRWWDAPKALQLGLIDRLASLDETLAELAAAGQQAARSARTATARARLALAERS